MKRVAAVALALAACGGDDMAGPDGGPEVDGGPDGAASCVVPTVDGADAYVADVVGHLAATPRASATQRTTARTYLAGAMQALGLETSVTSYGSGANVLGRLPSTTGASTWILIGAHFDTVTGSPGADDNATGVAAVLATARDLAAQPCRAHGVIVAAFDQEEIGLVGSTQLAGQLFSAGTQLVAVHTVDQVGWDRDGDRRFEIERPTNALWAEYQAAAPAAGVQVTRTTTESTDHASFRERGYPSTGVTEEFVSGDTSPHYHLASDTAATVDLAYTVRAARLVTIVVGRELGAAP